MSIPRYHLLCRHEMIKHTPFPALFSEAPLGFVDVGARAGDPPLAAPIASLTSFVGFEPDKEESDRMNGDTETAGYWAAYEVLPTALADTDGPVDLHLLELSTKHSLYPPNEAFAERYKPRGMAEIGVEKLQARTIDSLVYNSGELGADQVQFLKIDTQGSELDILRGAEQVLKDSTLCVVAEVEFCEFYSKQPYFSEVEQYLRSAGFSFYGLQTMNYRSQKRLDKRIEAGRERLLWSDAVFFKDPFDRESKLDDFTKKDLASLSLISACLEYYDFALELAEHVWGKSEHWTPINDFIRAIAYQDPAQTCEAVKNLSRETEQSVEDSNVIVGRFVDRRRHYSDFNDISV